MFAAEKLASFFPFTSHFSSVTFLPFMEFYGRNQIQITCAVYKPGNLQVIGIYPHTQTSPKKRNVPDFQKPL